mgnify:CR=1 FL=1
MSIFHKIRKGNFENGEYTPEENIDSTQVIRFFEEFDWNTNAEFTNECLIFRNDAKKNFCIEKYSKEVYQVYVIDFSTRYYLHKTVLKNGVIKVLTKFINNETLNVEDNFVRGADRPFVNSFKEQTFIYKTSFFKNLSKSFFWLIYLIITLVFSIYSIHLHNSFLVTTFPFLLFFFIWFPGLLVHINYWKYNKMSQIKISQGNTIFVLTQNGVSISYSKNEIKEIIRYELNTTRLPWTNYGFTRINLKNNQSIFLTDLLLDQFQIQHSKFPLNSILVKRRTYFPWIIS